jgi:hypothetical protein
MKLSVSVSGWTVLYMFGQINLSVSGWTVSYIFEQINLIAALSYLLFELLVI